MGIGFRAKHRERQGGKLHINQVSTSKVHYITGTIVTKTVPKLKSPLQTRTTTTTTNHPRPSPVTHRPPIPTPTAVAAAAAAVETAPAARWRGRVATPPTTPPTPPSLVTRRPSPPHTILEATVALQHAEPARVPT